MLTQEEALKLFEYKDGVLYNKVQRHRAKAGDAVGSPMKKGHLRCHIKNELYLVHRIIYLMHHGYMPEFVDHINGNPQDNHIVNLREATSSQNAHNQRLRSTNSSGVKGVCWYPRYGMWRGQIVVKGATVHVGYFKDISEAAEAVRVARENHHGEFARHN